MSDPKFWMTVQEAASKFRCSDTLIYRWIRQKRLKAVYRYERYLIPRAAKRPDPLKKGQGPWILEQGKRAQELNKGGKADMERRRSGISAALRLKNG